MKAEIDQVRRMVRCGQMRLRKLNREKQLIKKIINILGDMDAVEL
jgi:hypothetical protein